MKTFGDYWNLICGLIPFLASHHQCWSSKGKWLKFTVMQRFVASSNSLWFLIAWKICKINGMGQWICCKVLVVMVIALHTCQPIKWNLLMLLLCFPSMLWHCWLGNWKGNPPLKNWVLVCWWWRFHWSFARLIAPVVTTTYVILCFSKIQNGRHILVLASPGSPGKWPLKWRAVCTVVKLWFH